MDEEGCYWSALFDGWRIARFSPQGVQLEEYRLPVRCPTMVCFGGDEMKTLFITTTREIWRRRSWRNTRFPVPSSPCL